MTDRTSNLFWAGLQILLGLALLLSLMAQWLR